MGFFSWAFLVFLMKESKKRRRKQPGKLMVKSCSQPVSRYPAKKKHPASWIRTLNRGPCLLYISARLLARILRVAI